MRDSAVFYVGKTLGCSWKGPGCDPTCCEARSSSKYQPSVWPHGVFVSEGEIEGHTLLTILNAPPHIFTTSSSSLGSISGLLDTQRSWIWLHSLGPTGANVLPSIHQAGWPRGGRLWSACADRRWMRNRGLLPIAIFLLIPSSASPPVAVG